MGPIIVDNSSINNLDWLDSLVTQPESLDTRGNAIRTDLSTSVPSAPPELTTIQGHDLSNLSFPSAWTRKSKAAWSKSFGKEATIGDKIQNGLAVAGAAGSMASTAAGLGKINKGAESQVESLINNANRMRINTDSLDEIGQIANSHRYLKNNYSWKDFYRKGGHLHRYDAGGRIGMGIGSNTLTGATTGYQVGGPWGAVVGGLAGLGSGIWGAFAGHSHAKKVANNFNRRATDANSNWDSMLSSSIDNAKYRNLMGLFNTGTYDLGGFLGPWNSSTGAIDFNFMSDYLTMKNNQAKAKEGALPYLGNTASASPVYSTPFAFGGDLQTHGADYSTGLTHIDAGGTHEENPNGGVPMGIAQDGQSNLVEQNETINNALDYVYSEQLKLDKDAVEALRLPKRFKGKSFADVSKYYEKESKERPNDPISQRALREQLQELAEVQEAYKAAQQANEARKAFAALSPEEQQQVMAQVAQQQAAAQQPTEEVPVDENGNPVEGSEGQMMQQPEDQQDMQGFAYGGTLGQGHHFDGKSESSNQMTKNWRYTLNNAFKRYTNDAWNKWAKEQGLKDFDYSKITDISDYITKNQAFKAALAKENPIFADALSRSNGYLLGSYTPSGTGYDFAGYNDKLKKYTGSETAGNADNKYAVDTDFPMSDYGDYADARALEGAQFYKDYTNAVKAAMGRAQGIQWKPKADGTGFEVANGQSLNQDDYDLLNAVYNQMGRTSVKGGGHYPLFNTDNEGWISLADGAANTYDTKIRNDGMLGAGHLTPLKLTRGKNNTIYLDNGDGTYSEFIGDTKGYDTIGKYTYESPDATNTIQYIKAKESAKAKGNKEEDKIPYLDDRGRKVGIFAPLVSLAMKQAGLLNPDFTDLNAALSMTESPTERAGVHYIHNYKTYTPWDIWNTRSLAEAANRGVDRSITNNDMPVGAKLNAQLANGHTGQLAMADTEQKARTFDDSLLTSALGQNTDVDKFNAQAFNAASATNAEAANRQLQYRAGLTADIAKAKMTAQSQRDAGLISDAANFIKGIGQYYNENAAKNMLAAWLNSGGAGTLSPDMIYHGMGQGPWNTPKTSTPTYTKKGGRIHREKHGLTY